MLDFAMSATAASKAARNSNAILLPTSQTMWELGSTTEGAALGAIKQRQKKMKLQRTSAPARSDRRGTRFEMIDTVTRRHIDVIVTFEAVQKLIGAQYDELRILQTVIEVAEGKEANADNIPQRGLRLEASDFDVF